jgi:hypothetical protein
MISITVFVVYVIVALTVYATLNSIKNDLDDIPSPRIGGKWFNTINSDETYSDEEYEEMIIVASMVWPCSIMAALCLFIITSILVFIQMFKKNNN